MDRFLPGCLILWLLMCCFVFFCILIIHLFWDGKAGRIALAAAETLGALVLVQLLMDQLQRRNGTLLGQPGLVLLLDLSFTLAAAAELISCARAGKRTLTQVSVKECMDTLPVGICFYWDGGLQKLTNLQMDSIARCLTGSGILDAESFREAALSGKEASVVCLENGAVYSFVHHEDTIDGEPIHELLAFDVTEEYRLTEELQEKQEKARKLNARLRALAPAMQAIARDKEVLQIKIHIHDSFGRMLLMTRHCLSAPGNTDDSGLLSMWRENISLLKNGGQEKRRQPLFASLNRADSLGIRVGLSGELPGDEELLSVVDQAITVHVTNVLRHAEGTAAWIASERTDGGYRLRFTNNGLPPAADVAETGGLADLRRRTEEIGGSMSIRSAPAFELTLLLPEQAGEED